MRVSGDAAVKRSPAQSVWQTLCAQTGAPGSTFVESAFPVVLSRQWEADEIIEIEKARFIVPDCQPECRGNAGQQQGLCRAVRADEEEKLLHDKRGHQYGCEVIETLQPEGLEETVTSASA